MTKQHNIFNPNQIDILIDANDNPADVQRAIIQATQEGLRVNYRKPGERRVKPIKRREQIALF